MNETQKNTDDTSAQQAPKKKGGRPGRRVTRDKFFDVLRYFLDKNSAYTTLREPLEDIRRKAPYKYETPEAIAENIAAREGQIKRMTEDGYPTHDVERQLEELKAEEPKPLTEEHIALLQAWINKRVDKKEWAQACTAIRQKRLKEKRGCDSRITQIPITWKVKFKLDVLKEELGGEDWSATLMKMIELSREALEIRRSRAQAVKTREMNKPYR